MRRRFEPPPLPRTLRASASQDAAYVTKMLHARGVGDGHPVIPPLPVRVAEMLAGHDPDEPLGPLAPLHRDATVEDVAVCAVLAGCPPAALPALCAAVRAVQRDQFNLLGLTTTTGSAAIGMVLHGAIARAVGANAGANFLGPGNLANASIGRALAFVVRAVGGAVPGVIDVAIAGQPAKYGLCFADLPPQEGWPGLHEERGFPDDPGAVTVIGISGTIEVVDATSKSVVDLLDTLAGAMVLPVSVASDGSAIGGSGEPVIIIPPEWVGRLRAEGWTKQRVREHLWEKARVPIDRLAYGLAGRVAAEAARDGWLCVSHRPDDITLLVAGGPGTKATLMPMWGNTRSVTVPVRP